MSLETEAHVVIVPDTIEGIEICCEAVVPSTCDLTARWGERITCPKCGPVTHLFCELHHKQSVQFWTQPGWQPVHRCGTYLFNPFFWPLND